MADGRLKTQDTSDNANVHDGFWDIALMHYHGHGARLKDFDDEEIIDHQNCGKFTSYHLPNTSITLRLTQLPQEDGVWSPVGSDAWYSSALLTSLILREVMTPESSTSQADRMFPQTHEKAIPLRILELGSGAKALSGFAAAAALSLLWNRYPSWTVTLTDNNVDILHQLESNVAANKHRIISTDKSTVQHINVEHLDWGAAVDIASYSNQLSTLDADIVIGSELVYSTETATALAKMLSVLLQRNPHAEIWIVQVIDRHGWNDIVIPSLQSQPNFKIEHIPLTWDIHDTAGGLMQMGGVLDHYAFGAVRISKVLK
jgi:hypothetical protein